MSTKRDLEQFCKMARELGATDAKIISTKNVVTAEWVRWKCQYGCGLYGQHLTCPPYSPTPETTRKVLNEYQYAILVHGNRTSPLREIGAEMERRIFLTGYYKAFAFLCGPCNLCTTCAAQKVRDGDAPAVCQHPEKARPAMEAAGIDVFATARGAGFPIEVIHSPTCKQNYYALVLVE